MKTRSATVLMGAFASAVLLVISSTAGAWSDPRAHNYYWTKFGRSATQNPLGQHEMWSLLREPDFEDLEIG